MVLCVGYCVVFGFVFVYCVCFVVLFFVVVVVLFVLVLWFGCNFFLLVDVGEIVIYVCVLIGMCIEEMVVLFDCVECMVCGVVLLYVFVSIVDNMGLLNSGINFMYSNSGMIGL